MQAERDLGRVPQDVSAKRGIGYDIKSTVPNDQVGADEPHVYMIEVKGRALGADSVTLTANEVRAANNCRSKGNFRLAIVEIDGDVVHDPIYVSEYQYGELGFNQTSSQYSLESLKQKGGAPS